MILRRYQIRVIYLSPVLGGRAFTKTGTRALPTRYWTWGGAERTALAFTEMWMEHQDPPLREYHVFDRRDPEAASWVP